MPKIVLINVRADYQAAARGIAKTHPVTVSGWRHMWFANAGDIVIIPAAAEEEFLRYIGEVLGFDAGTVKVVYRKEILSDEVILSEDFVEELRKHLTAGEQWRLAPCFTTAGVAELAELLGIDLDTGLRFAAQRGPELFNRKAHFRQLAAGVGLPLPSGCIVRAPHTLVRAIERQLVHTGSVIVKADNAAGGHGNIIITKAATAPLPGSRETRQVDGDLAPVAEQLWQDLTNPQSQVLVVESYHSAAHIIYFEYLIGDDGIPTFLNSGTPRLESDVDPEAPGLVWVGLDIPADLPPFSLTNAASCAMRFAMLAASLGYRGYINIDAIITESGELLFNESNARWGGGLALHEVSSRLLGRRYTDELTVSNVRNIHPVPFTDLLGALRDDNLLFKPDAKEGVVVMACDPTGKDNTECLIIASSRKRNRQIQAQLRQAVNRLCQAK